MITNHYSPERSPQTVSRRTKRCDRFPLDLLISSATRSFRSRELRHNPNRCRNS